MKSSYAREKITSHPRGGRSFWKIHFFIESGLNESIQYSIQNKIQNIHPKNIYLIECGKFNRTIHSKKLRKIVQN